MVEETQLVHQTAGRADVLAAIHSASAKTGSDFDYLLATAMRESRLDTQAKSKSSSATGLFQFLDQTWLGLVKRFGERHGLADYARAIIGSGNGHYTVSSENTRTAILALRKDPEMSALMAGEAANETKLSLKCALGREACGGELYIAHFLGTGAARRLIELKHTNPDHVADETFPKAAKANRSVFYHDDGTAKTVSELYAWAVNMIDGSRPQSRTAARAEIPTPQATMTASSHDPGSQAVAEVEPAALLMTPEPASDAPLNTFNLRSSLGWKDVQPSLPVRPQLPRSPLVLSLGVLEVLSSLPITSAAFSKDES